MTSSTMHDSHMRLSSGISHTPRMHICYYTYAVTHSPLLKMPRNASNVLDGPGWKPKLIAYVEQNHTSSCFMAACSTAKEQTFWFRRMFRSSCVLARSFSRKLYLLRPTTLIVLYMESFHDCAIDIVVVSYVRSALCRDRPSR